MYFSFTKQSNGIFYIFGGNDQEKKQNMANGFSIIIIFLKTVPFFYLCVYTIHVIDEKKTDESIDKH